MSWTRRSAVLLLTFACIACDSDDAGAGDIEATLSVDPRFVVALQSGPIGFDVIGESTADSGVEGVVSVYVSRANAMGCIRLDGADAQDEGPFVGFDATADIYRFSVDLSSFTVDVAGECLGACTADAATEVVLADGTGAEAEPLTEAVFFNIECTTV